MISKSHQRAKEFANSHGYTLRKIKEGKVKIVRPNDSSITAHDSDSAYMQIMSEVYKDHSKKNIFE